LSREKPASKKPFFQANRGERLRRAGCWALFSETADLNADLNYWRAKNLKPASDHGAFPGETLL
jgi:hypothetical protein